VGRENNEKMPPFKVKIKLFRIRNACGNILGVLFAHATKVIAGTNIKTNLTARPAFQSMNLSREGSLIAQIFRI
jgi:hypothetical protein